MLPKGKDSKGPMAENTSHLDDLLGNVTLGLPCQILEGKVSGDRQGCTPIPTGPPYGKSLNISPILSGYKFGFDPQGSLENTRNTMGTLLGVHPIVP